MHLRVEEDAATWHGMFGGERPYWQAYSKEADRVGLGNAPVYIATGAWESQNKTLVKVCGSGWLWLVLGNGVAVADIV